MKISEIVCYFLSIQYQTMNKCILCVSEINLPLKVPTKVLLIMCHNWGSPVFGESIRCCLQCDTSRWAIGPPGTVIQRICDGNGTGNQPVSGTRSGTVYPSHQAVADCTVIPNRECSPSYAETVRNRIN